MTQKISDKILNGQDEICIYAGISRAVWVELVAKGFPAVQIGGKWRAHTDNIDAWMKVVTVPRGPQQYQGEHDG